jgi:hypothetical protein
MEFEDVLKVIENDDHLLLYQHKGLKAPFYPLIRSVILPAYLSGQLGLDDPFEYGIKLHVSKRNIIRLSYDSFLSIISIIFGRNLKNRVFIIAPGGGNMVENSETAGYFHKFARYFSDFFQNSAVIIEDQVDQNYYSPRTEKKVINFFLIKGLILLLSKVIPVSGKSVSMINGLINDMDKQLKFTDSLCQQIKKKSKELYVRAYFEYLLFHYLFKKYKPRFILVEEAIYGRKLPVILAAKRTGTRTGEYQHGFISHGHWGYNYGHGLISSDDFKVGLPDFFLSFGNYWNNVFNAPVKKYILGYPHLEEGYKRLQRKHEPKNLVLLISGGGSISDLNDLILNIRKIFGPGQEILFRPHPGERIYIEKRYPALKSCNVETDLSSDLYSILNRSMIVIGELSTVLLEALFYNCKVYVLKNKTYETFGKEIMDIITPITLEDIHDGNLPDPVNSSGGDIWATGWVNNFHSAISKMNL